MNIRWCDGVFVPKCPLANLSEFRWDELYEASSRGTGSVYFRMQKITPDQMRAIGEICRTFSRRLDKGAKPGVIVTELIKMFPEPSPTQKQILKEVQRSLRGAGEAENPKPIYDVIVDVLCNWGDTLDEDDVLASLKAITARMS